METFLKTKIANDFQRAFDKPGTIFRRIGEIDKQQGLHKIFKSRGANLLIPKNLSIIYEEF